MASTPAYDSAVPNLPSEDFNRTETFYAGFGFKRQFRDSEWMTLTRGALQLEFFPARELLGDTLE
jgi:hypothetical protein